MDKLEKIFEELFYFKEGFVGLQTKPVKDVANIISDKNKNPTLVNFLETMPKGQKFFLDIGPWMGYFGHELYKNNQKLMKDTYLIGIDSAVYKTIQAKCYGEIPMKNLENVMYDNKCIFNINKINKKHYLLIDKDFPKNLSIYGTGKKYEKDNLGDYGNMKKLFTKEFLERGFETIFLRRMLQYVWWETVIEKTCKFTNSYCIIDYNKREFEKEENLRNSAVKYILKKKRYKKEKEIPEDFIEAVAATYQFWLKMIPYPEDVNKLLRKKGFEICDTKTKETYFYTLAKR